MIERGGPPLLHWKKNKLGLRYSFSHHTWIAFNSLHINQQSTASASPSLSLSPFERKKKGHKFRAATLVNEFHVTSRCAYRNAQHSAHLNPSNVGGGVPTRLPRSSLLTGGKWSRCHCQSQVHKLNRKSFKNDRYFPSQRNKAQNSFKKERKKEVVILERCVL